MSGGVTADDIAQEKNAMQPIPKQPTTLRVKVLRNFQNHERKILEKGSEATLPRIFALEMKAANKVEIIEEAAPTQAAPAEEKSRVETGNGNGRKGVVK